MIKEEYLNQSIILDFIEWIGKKLDSDFKHSYLINAKNREWIKYNNRLSKWECTSIYDAYLKYSWDGSNFKLTSETLNEYEVSLRNSLKENDSKKTDQACYNILKWGGQRVFTHNYAWVQKIDDKCEYFKKNIKALNPIDFNDDKNLVKSNNVDRFNAGFTKIYSLCIDDFIIYDSRVGIALTYLISQFLIERKLETIPSLLEFKIPPGSSSKRHPNRINGYHFGKTNNMHQYQIANVRASWLFARILDNNTKSEFCSLPPNQRMRALEAAFFMIGYSI